MRQVWNTGQQTDKRKRRLDESGKLTEMKKTIGILAHVDGGKTTFSEQLLYHAGILKTPGRVDQGNTLLDSDPVERSRGITIFTDQSPFVFEGNTYYLMDTPGHVDFSAEMERAVMALDAAILLVAAGSGVTAHTVTLWRILEKYKVPAFLFFNKMDLEGADREKLLFQVRERLSTDAVLVAEPEAQSLESGTLQEGETEPSRRLTEFICEREDRLLERYLSDSLTGDELKSGAQALIRERKLFLCMCGSALRDQGIVEFFRLFNCMLEEGDEKEREELPFRGLVYKIRHDDRQNRLTFIKILQGKLRVRDEIRFCQQAEYTGSSGRDGEETNGAEKGLEEAAAEKIHEIRSYCGKKFSSMKEASAGELCAVTGLSIPRCGSLIGTGGREMEKADFFLVPSLAARVIPEEAQAAASAEEFQRLTDERTELMQKIIRYMRLLEEEEPQLSLSLSPLTVSVMGEIQLEIIKQMFRERWGIDIAFLPPKVIYKETIGKPVMGYGHYEPLRHYAEVAFRLEPGERGSGIQFRSECPLDELAQNYQNLIRTHVFERVHRGILTGAPLTDVTVVLTAGRAHQKHTEGGDFREAVYRAVRQGLEKAENILLEPFYRFEIAVENSLTGRVMADIQKRSGTFEPPVSQGSMTVIAGRGPVSEFADYPAELAAFSRGGGSISLISDGYDACHDASKVIEEIAYDKGADKENTSASVFCAHGAGFLVAWDQAERYMHCLKK